MFKSTTIALAMTVAAMVTGNARAATLDFSDLVSGGCNFVGSPDVVSQGYKFTDISTGGLFLCDAGVLQNNTSPALVAANAPSILAFARDDSALFSLQSFFAGARTSDFDPSSLNGFTNAAGIVVSGTTGSGTVSQTFNFIGNSFTQFSLSPTFTGLSSVTITAFGAVSSPEFLINNITVDGATVPEPATWAMLVIGFGMAGGALRRRQHGAARVIA